MAQGSSPTPELLCGGVCSESLTQHTAPPSAPQIKSSIFMALGKSHKRSVKILLLHYEEHFVWLLCPAGSQSRVVRSCLTCPVMNCSAVAAQGLSDACWDLLPDIWADHDVSPAVSTEGCQPSKAVLWHQCDSRAEHSSSPQRCTALNQHLDRENLIFSPLHEL